MIADQFHHLFTPFRIKNVTVRNRIMSIGHRPFFTPDGLPSKVLAYYHAERAKGGVGLIVVERAAIHPTSPAGVRFDRCQLR